MICAFKRPCLLTSVFTAFQERPIVAKITWSATHFFTSCAMAAKRLAVEIKSGEVPRGLGGIDWGRAVERIPSVFGSVFSAVGHCVLGNHKSGYAKKN